MTFRERLKGVAIALFVLLMCLPVAVAGTILTSPFWRWFETQSGIEAYGHSGPAEWCYLVTYGVLVTIATFIWWRTNQVKSNDETD